MSDQHVDYPAQPQAGPPYAAPQHPPTPYAERQPSQAPYAATQSAHGYGSVGRPQPHHPTAPSAALAPVGYVAPAVRAPADGPLGKVRGTGIVFLLALVTLGIYYFVYIYKTHEEMKRHTGTGIGGGLALLLYIVFSPASVFLLPSEVGNLYSRKGGVAPVGGATGLWVIPGAIVPFLPLVWLVKTNGALNAYWRSQGALG